MGEYSAWASKKGKCCPQTTLLLTFCTTCHGLGFQCHLTLLRHLAITLKLHVGSPLRSGCFITPLSALRFLRRKGTTQGVAHYSHCAPCQLSHGVSYYSFDYTEVEQGSLRGKGFPLVRAIGPHSYFGKLPLRQWRPSNFSRLRNPLEISNKSNPLFSGKTSVDNHVECSSIKENQDMHHRWLQPRWRLRLSSC